MISILILMACGETEATKASSEEELGPFSISSILPREVSSAGGDRVVIEGIGFAADDIVRVNGTECASTFFASDSQLACLTPATSVGEGALSVTRQADQLTAEVPISVQEPVGNSSEDDSAEPVVEDTGDTEDATPDEPEAVVEYCHLQWPCTMEVVAGQPSEDVYSWVYVAGVTDQVGQGDNIQVALGVGDLDAEPLADWDWSECSYFKDIDGLTTGDVANDEYVGAFEAPADAGTYRYAVRARIGEGSWTLCDFGASCGGEGSTDGFDINATGELTVVVP